MICKGPQMHLPMQHVHVMHRRCRRLAVPDWQEISRLCKGLQVALSCLCRVSGAKDEWNPVS